MKRREVIFAARATQDLRWIFDIVADAAGPYRAGDYVQRIRRYCEGFDLASERGHRRDDIRAGVRIVGFERRVTIAFAVGDESVEILRVLYGGADWEQDL
jgi:toxin ParE1/3/4